MIDQDFSRFRQLARKGNLVAVTGTIPADLETPVSSFLKTAGSAPNVFLLESAEQEEHVGRFSIIGLEPREILMADAGKALYEIRGSRRRRLTEKNILNLLKARMKQYRLANREDIPGFTGGYVGYLSYENVEDFEDIRLTVHKKESAPKAVYFLCHDFLIFDHFRKQLKIVSMAEVSSAKELKKAYDSAVRKIRSVSRDLSEPLRFRSSGKAKHAAVKASANMTRGQFESKVKRIREYIRAGDCIQVVLSQRFTMANKKDDFQIYRALRSINPSPYMFYFRFGELRLVGSSPEVLVKKTGGEAEVRPIAGTRSRGRSPAEDMRLEESLKKSRKEMAEHLMLVDLGRNDLGRVCTYDSVQVKNFARVERYSHVMHLVSDVAGKLRKGKDAFDLLRSVFPAGTLSGAPKIRAMQIINELEPQERGPYGGCLGYFSFTGDMDMCITIRTLVVTRSQIYFQAGAGIVKDSNPSKEYEETVNKAGALMKALEEEGRFDAARHR